MAFAAPFLAHDDQRRLVQASAKRQFVQPIQHRPLWRVSPFDDEGHCIGEIDQIGAIDQNLQWRQVQHDDIELLPGAGDELRENLRRKKLVGRDSRAACADQCKQRRRAILGRDVGQAVGWNFAER